MPKDGCISCPPRGTSGTPGNPRPVAPAWAEAEQGGVGVGGGRVPQCEAQGGAGGVWLGQGRQGRPPHRRSRPEWDGAFRGRPCWWGDFGPVHLGHTS